LQRASSRALTACCFRANVVTEDLERLFTKKRAAAAAKREELAGAQA
jgi:hypothetical protein